MIVKQGISRAEAARKLNVSKARVTQYVQEGMPALPDGSIDLDQARAWLAANIDPAKRAGWAETKRQRRAEAANSGHWAFLRDFPDPAHRAFAYAAGTAIYRSAFHAVAAAADAGVDRAQALALARMTQLFLWAELDMASQHLGMHSPDGSEEVLHLEKNTIDGQLELVPWPELFASDGRSLVTGRSRTG